MSKMRVLLFLLTALSSLSAKLTAAGANNSLSAIESLSNSLMSSSGSGPVTAAMENLAYNTSSITFEMASQVNTKLERTLDIMRGNIEVIVSSAMQKLAQPIFRIKEKIDHGVCTPDWTLAELQTQFNAEMKNCTQNLNNIMNVFTQQATDIESNIQADAYAINRLPSLCQMQNGDNSLGFSNSISCFVEKIADINQHVGGELQRMNAALIRSRQQSKESMKEAKQCSDEVTDNILELLDGSGCM